MACVSCMVYDRRGVLRVAYVWKLLRYTDTLDNIISGSSKIKNALLVLCVLAISRRLLGDPLGTPLGPSWEPLGRLLEAFWDVLERLGRPLEG